MNISQPHPHQPLPLHDIQGILLRGYGHLHEARFLLLTVKPDRQAQVRRFLAQLPLTEAERAARRGAEPGPFVNVAFTHAGLTAIGLPGALLDAFPQEYVEGSADERKARLLGDEGESSPPHWLWGSHDKPPVHVAILAYATRETIEAHRAKYVEGAAEAGLELVLCLEATRLPQRQEHFGFRDGIAQPDIRGAREGTPAAGNTIAPGELLLGQPNEFGEIADCPGPFTRNGSYLVLRQLEQDVPGFWRFCRDNVTSDDEAIHLASRMVGRWPSGAPLVKYPHYDPRTEAASNDNVFGYSNDLDGYRCPYGSHVRRCGPRDSMVVGKKEESLRVVARHRMIRRGRPYGAPFCSSGDPRDYLKALHAPDPSPNRGLHFLAFNANIEQQFEFVQQQWCDNPKLAAAANGADPLIGNHRTLAGAPATFSIQHPTTAQRVKIPRRFVQVRGGAYFFMPALSAVQSL